MAINIHCTILLRSYDSRNITQRNLNLCTWSTPSQSMNTHEYKHWLPSSAPFRYSYMANKGNSIVYQCLNSTEIYHILNIGSSVCMQEICALENGLYNFSHDNTKKFIFSTQKNNFKTMKSSYVNSGNYMQKTAHQKGRTRYISDLWWEERYELNHELR